MIYNFYYDKRRDKVVFHWSRVGDPRIHMEAVTHPTLNDILVAQVEGRKRAQEWIK